MKIGLFGGSFNPIHNTHLRIINEVLNKKLVDEIWIILCKKHAFDKNLEKIIHRINVINLAIKDKQKIKLNRVELNEVGKSYTLKTINKLNKKYNHEFFLIIGSDILQEVKKWYKYKILLKKIKFIIVKRKNFPIKKILGMRIQKVIIRAPTKISSTEIRQRIFHKRPFNKMVPKKVEQYIFKNKLYSEKI